MSEPLKPHADEATPNSHNSAETGPGVREGSATGLGSSTPSGLDSTRISPPSYLFFGGVAAVSLLADVSSKAWAELKLTSIAEPALVLVEDQLAFVLAYNRGGAWGLFRDQDEMIRRPFFLLASALAVVFIVSLYAKIAPSQKALRWGLPLVLGGALGNLADRIIRGQVVDFIDYQASWVEGMNTLIAKVVDGWHVTNHWPTFNVADISICVGVGLMAVDMFTHKREPQTLPNVHDSADAANPAH